MFSRILHRPALAIVVSLLILFMGGLSITMLPTSQFPRLHRPAWLWPYHSRVPVPKFWSTRF